MAVLISLIIASHATHTGLTARLQLSLIAICRLVILYSCAGRKQIWYTA